MAVQPGLCGTWSETPKTGFLTTRLNFGFVYRFLVLNVPVPTFCLPFITVISRGFVRERQWKIVKLALPFILASTS